MLKVLLIIPLIAIFLIIPIEKFNNGESRIKIITLMATLLNFAVSIIIWTNFDSNTTIYQFTEEFNSVCHLYIGIDQISLYFVMLTTFIIPICILSNWNNVISNLKIFLMCFLLLETLLIAVFVVLDFILFYVFFESVLIPLFLIIGIFGGSYFRIRAAFILFLYTLFGSLFILLSIIVIYYNVGSTDYQIIQLNEISLDMQKILFIGIFISIAVKSPIFFVNSWLTYAHSEAPVAGSIILASVILKLSLYGYLRIILQFFPDATNYFGPAIQILCTISIIYSSLCTIRQTDFKKLVAYSSVAHIGIVILGIFSNNIQGIEGSIILGLGHGFVSPALFFLVGGVLYDRFHTRTIKYYRGLVTYIPIFTTIFFLFTIFNAATPLSINWIGEFLCLTGIYQVNPIICIFASISIVLSATYSIWLFNRMCYGQSSNYLGYTIDLNRREFHILIPLLFVTIFYGINPNIILDNLHISISTLIYSLYGFIP